MAQESMPVTPEEVCSRAMVLCGLEPMASFSETGRDEVIVASQTYELMTMSALSSYPWTFATGEQQLELSTHDPLDRYESAWHYPTLDEGRPIQLQQILSGDFPVSYELLRNLIYTRSDPTAELIAHYQYRTEEVYWLPQFMLYHVFSLSAMFAGSVTRNAKQIDTFGRMMEMHFARAKTRDAQSKTAKRARMTALRRPGNRWPSNLAT